MRVLLLIPKPCETFCTNALFDYKLFDSVGELIQYVNVLFYYLLLYHISILVFDITTRAQYYRYIYEYCNLHNVVMVLNRTVIRLYSTS